MAWGSGSDSGISVFTSSSPRFETDRVVLGVVAAVHVAHLLCTAWVPGLADLYILDSRVYDEMADAFATVGFFAGDEAFGHAPLYPLWLAALRRISDLPLTPLVLQVALGILNAALVGALARRVFDARAAAPAIALYGLYAPAAMLETKLMASTLGVTLVLAALRLLVEARPDARQAPCAVAGVALGAACLVRPNTLLFVPLAALFVVIARGGLRAPRAWGSAALFLGASILVIAPVSFRNLSVSGDFVLVTAHGGMTLYQSNNERAEGIYSPIPGSVGNPRVLAERLRERAEAESGEAMRLSDVDSEYRDRALAFLASDFERTSQLVGRKLRFWLGNDEVSTEYTLPTERTLTPTLWLMPVPFAAVLALAGFGIHQALRARRFGATAGLLGAFVLSNLASVLLFYFSSRYRLPAVPVLCVFAGYGCMSIRERVETRRWDRGGWLVLLLGLAVLSWIPISDDADRYAFHQWFNYGVAQDERGDYEAAVESFERALVGMQDHWHVHLALGRAYARTDRLEEALARYRRAVEMRPQSRDAREGVESVRTRLRERGSP